ncbi:MAG TPA: NAD(P)H-binding protein [Acidimicrobiales bacterium]|nr:NAD(P)H-binding protein [Acidimicrobiales bacterium]
MTEVTSATARADAGPAGGLDAVTGAFGYSGRSIARRLLGTGRTVRTLTGHPGRGGNQHEIEVRPLDFDDPAGLVSGLEGVTTLYNTYWVRFAHGSVDHALAVENSRALFTAARRAGVCKIVHVSILHPSVSSPYPYFRGKALVERALVESEIPYAVLRPSVLFDEEGILLNNIAWLLRHLPVFAVGGDGRYRVRPIHVEDLATLALEAAGWTDDRIVDAVGPERPTSSSWWGRSGTPWAAGPGWCACPPASCSSRPGSSGPCCTTCSSPRRSTGRWPRAWPTRTPRPRARSGCRRGCRSTVRAWAPAIATSSTAISGDRGSGQASLVAILHAPTTVHTTSQAAMTATATGLVSGTRYDVSRRPAGPLTIV